MVAALLATGCDGPQSALAPASLDAARVAELFWWMVAGSAAIWLAVITIGLYAARGRPRSERAGRRLILVAGALLPTLVLGALLIYGLRLMPSAHDQEADLRIEVVGEQWWWRVRYLRDDGGPVELANEVRLPRGARAEFILSSPDVIHAFWIPSLGGKRDMIPGRITRLVLRPDRVGEYRGACAEYCGGSHALMAFPVVVMEPAEFDAWLRAQAAPARAPGEEPARRGQALFLANGCGGCHSVRGTEADGVIGPDLTHVGSRLSLGAGVLPNEPAEFARWLAHTERIKPEVRMPAYSMLAREELDAIAAYLEGLQ